MDAVGDTMSNDLVNTLVDALVRDELDIEIDAFERELLEKGDLIEAPVVHTFTPGLYIREIFMTKGSLLTSKIHNTQHPFTILEGCALVSSHNGGSEILEAGHTGITEPHTRRAIYIEEDCRWITYHVLSEEEEELRKSGATLESILSVIEDRIIEKRPENAGVFEEYQKKLRGQS